MIFYELNKHTDQNQISKYLSAIEKTVSQYTQHKDPVIQIQSMLFFLSFYVFNGISQNPKAIDTLEIHNQIKSFGINEKTFDHNHKNKLDNPGRKKMLPASENLIKAGLKLGDTFIDVGSGTGHFAFRSQQ